MREQLSSKTILVVEDEGAVRDVVVKMLATFGYRVLAAQDPQQAIEVLNGEGESIDLVLTDIALPETDYGDFFTLLAANKWKLKVLFMSGYGKDALRRCGVPNTGVDFISKPFSVASIKKKLQEMFATATVG